MRHKITEQMLAVTKSADWVRGDVRASVTPSVWIRVGLEVFSETLSVEAVCLAIVKDVLSRVGQ